MKIDDVIQSKFQSSIQKVMVNVRYTSNFFGSKQNTFMAKHGLSMAQFNILRILRGSGKSISVNAIKERMVEKSPNTTRLMDKLLNKGLIVRERCEVDRRIVFVSISDAGLKVLADIDDEVEDAGFFPQTLTDDEAEQLSDLLDKLRG